MKKWLSILLVLALALGLCACGGTAQPSAGGTGDSGTETAADAQEGTEAAEPEPEKVYVTKTVYKLVRMTEEVVPDYLLDDLGPVAYSGKRVTEYAYDEFGEPAGETVSYLCSLAEEYLNAAESAERRDDITVERDDNGNLISVSKPGEEIKAFLSSSGWATTETGTFENGVLTHIEQVGNDNGTTVETIDLEYHPNGILSRETTKNPVMRSASTIFTFESPLVSVREFNEDGRCTLLHTEDINLDTDALRLKEYSWQYDANGNPVSMEYKEGTANNTPMDDPEITYYYSAEMQYDAQNRMVSSSVHVNGDTNPVDFVYHYGSDGRLSGFDAKTGELTQKAEYEYGENGLLAVNHYTYNDSTRDIVYTWEEDENGRLEGTNSDGSEGVFPTSNSMTVYPDWKDDRGNVTRESHYELMPSLAGLFPIYVEFEKNYKYDKVSIKVEADPEAMAAAEAQAGAVEDYYPELNDSYGGYPVPTPDGSLRLIGITRRSSYVRILFMNTDLLYDEHGSLVGSNAYFDAVASYDFVKNGYSNWIVEADELGRLAKVTFYPTEGNASVTEIIYPDDSVTPEKYQFLWTYMDESEEGEVSVADYNARDEIRKSQSELNPDKEYEYDEDGLVVKASWTDSDGSPISNEYTHEYHTDKDGLIQSVSGGSNSMRFEDGYLSEYSLMPAVSAHYEYHYVPAA